MATIQKRSPRPVGPLPLLATRRRTRRTRERGLTAQSRRELTIFGLLYLVYDGSRWAFAGHLPEARAHAHWIIALERSMHVAVERSVQRDLASGIVSSFLADVYVAAQLVVLPAALIWVYRRSPAVYRQLRNTVVVSWLIAVPVFALFPVAPPRLVGIGLKDTVSRQSGFPLTGHSTLFYNPYAAVPSLHVGLAFAIGIALAATTRSRWRRALALCWGPLVTLAVVATGNHYVFDVAAGIAVAAVAYAASRLSDRITVPPAARMRVRMEPLLIGSRS